ncbi:MAG: hypothetical protein PHN88_09085 [Ignavibacteria bacterium]|nr:hypothetical protein [Ignavibacteria bacterium]
MKFADVFNKVIALDNLLTSETFDSASYGPGLMIYYSGKKEPLFIHFESMEKAEEANKKLIEELKNAGYISK